MTPNEYPLDFIKVAAERLRGQIIPTRTWTNYKRFCDIPKHAQTCTKQQSVYLLTYAYLRKDKPRAKITRFEVLRELRNPTIANLITQAIDNIYYCNAYGRDLPQVIYYCTGQKVSMRTLYRWAERRKIELHAGQLLTRTEIEAWLAWIADWTSKTSVA